jgi:hypothetical protein
MYLFLGVLCTSVAVLLVYDYFRTYRLMKFVNQEFLRLEIKIEQLDLESKKKISTLVSDLQRSIYLSSAFHTNN